MTTTTNNPIPDYIKAHIAAQLAKLPEEYRGLARNALEYEWKYPDSGIECTLVHADGTQITAEWSRRRIGDNDYYLCSVTIGKKFPSSIKAQK